MLHEKTLGLFKIGIIIVANGVNRPLAFNTPVHYKLWIHTRDNVILFSKFTKYFLWIWHLLQFMSTEFKLRPLSAFGGYCIAVQRPRKQCLLKNCISFLLLPQLESGTEISERQTWTFYALLPCSGAVLVPSNGRGHNGSCKFAFTYFSGFHIHPRAMDKHPYVLCFF